MWPPERARLTPARAQPFLPTSPLSRLVGSAGFSSPPRREREQVFTAAAVFVPSSCRGCALGAGAVRW